MINLTLYKKTGLKQMTQNLKNNILKQYDIPSLSCILTQQWNGVTLLSAAALVLLKVCRSRAS